MSKTRDRILVITDLLLGAAYADSRLDGAEQAAVRRLLRELLGEDELPTEVEAHIKKFSSKGFDLRASARSFAIDPPFQKRKLLELVAQVHEANDELDFDENAYLVELAQSLAVPEAEYQDLTLKIEVEELRTNLAKLRPPPPLPPGAKAGVDVDIDLDD